MSDMSDSRDLTQWEGVSPTKAIHQVPTISGEAYQHLGRYSGAVIAAVFERIGGVERMAAWADANPTDFYTKLFPKTVQRTASVDHSGTITIDDAISRVERGGVIEAEFDEVEPDLVYDL